MTAGLQLAGSGTEPPCQQLTLYCQLIEEPYRKSCVFDVKPRIATA